MKTEKSKLFSVSGTIVPAGNAVDAKRRVRLYAPQKSFGSYGSLRAVEVSGPDAELELIAQKETAESFVEKQRAKSDGISKVFTSQLLAILQEAELVIYEQARPQTAGQAAYNRAQDLRNGALSNAITELRRKLEDA